MSKIKTANKNKTVNKTNKNSASYKQKMDRLNFSMLVAAGVMVFLALFLIILFTSRNATAKNTITTAPTSTPVESTGENSTEEITTPEEPYEEETTEEIETLEFDADAMGNSGSSSRVRLLISTSNKWIFEEDGYVCVQYRIRLRNKTSSNIENWGFALHFEDDIQILDNWNGFFEVDGMNIKITPTTKTYIIAPGEEIDIGVVVKTTSLVYPSSYTLVLDDSTSSGRLNFAEETTTAPTSPSEEFSTTDDESTTVENPSEDFSEEETTTENESTDVTESSGQFESSSDEVTTEETTTKASTEGDKPDNKSPGHRSENSLEQSAGDVI